ncbi:MAG: cation transporter [Gallionella sp.]
MKKLLMIALAMGLGIIHSVYARTIEIEVYGMTCPFCVDSLERKFGKMQSVSKVEVSLKQKKIRLVTDKTRPSIKTIKQAVLDAGFTPVKITEKVDEE